MTVGREDGTAAALGKLRISHAEREQAIDVLKAAFVQGRLTKDEFDLRVGQVFASRTYANLDALTADIPDGVSSTEPSAEHAREPSRVLSFKTAAALAQSVPPRAWLLLRPYCCGPTRCRRLPACCSWP